MPSEDIKNLFSRFGSRSGRYHEIVREDQQSDSVGRWPLLSAVHVGEVRNIPGVMVKPIAQDPSMLAAEDLAVMRTAHQQPSPVVQEQQGQWAQERRPLDAAHQRASTADAATDRTGLFGWGRGNPAAAQGAGVGVGAAHVHLAPKPPAPVAMPVGAEAAFNGSPRQAVRIPPEAAPVEPEPMSRASIQNSAPAVAAIAGPLGQAKPSAAPLASTRVAAAAPAAVDRSLQGVFGRLGGPVAAEPAGNEAGRPLPVFRRLRRS
jgi:hypothetical protein